MVLDRLIDNELLKKVYSEKFIKIFDGYLYYYGLENDANKLRQKLLERKNNFSKELRQLLGSARKREK